MTKKELQSRGNQKEQKEGRKVRGIRKAFILFLFLFFI